MADEINASSFKVFVGPTTFLVVSCEKTCTFSMTATEADTSCKDNPWKTGILVKSGATITGSGILKAGDTSTETIRDQVMSRGVPITVHIRAVNDEMYIGDVNFVEFTTNSSDGDVAQLNYSGTFTGAVSIVADA